MKLTTIVALVCIMCFFTGVLLAPLFIGSPDCPECPEDTDRYFSSEFIWFTEVEYGECFVPTGDSVRLKRNWLKDAQIEKYQGVYRIYYPYLRPRSMEGMVWLVKENPLDFLREAGE